MFIYTFDLEDTEAQDLHPKDITEQHMYRVDKS